LSIHLSTQASLTPVFKKLLHQGSAFLFKDSPTYLDAMIQKLSFTDLKV